MIRNFNRRENLLLYKALKYYINTADFDEVKSMYSSFEYKYPEEIVGMFENECLPILKILKDLQ